MNSELHCSCRLLGLHYKICFPIFADYTTILSFKNSDRQENVCLSLLTIPQYYLLQIQTARKVFAYICWLYHNIIFYKFRQPGKCLPFSAGYTMLSPTSSDSQENVCLYLLTIPQYYLLQIQTARKMLAFLCWLYYDIKPTNSDSQENVYLSLLTILQYYLLQIQTARKMFACLCWLYHDIFFLSSTNSDRQENVCLSLLTLPQYYLLQIQTARKMFAYLCWLYHDIISYKFRQPVSLLTILRYYLLQVKTYRKMFAYLCWLCILQHLIRSTLFATHSAIYKQIQDFFKW